MITIKVKGKFEKTNNFLKKELKALDRSKVEQWAQMGLEALKKATPVDTGETRSSWFYEIIETEKGVNIIWANRNVQNGANIAILIQYDHATGTGGFVKGVDYINPALRPVYDEIVKQIRREVT